MSRNALQAPGDHPIHGTCPAFTGDEHDLQWTIPGTNAEPGVQRPTVFVPGGYILPMDCLGRQEAIRVREANHLGAPAFVQQ